MPWDSSRGPTHPKYRTREHVRYTKQLKAQLKVEGYLVCTAATCVLPTRLITNPNGREPDGLHAGHADDGVTYAGPQHAACNVKDGARRGRSRQITPTRWAL